VGLLVDPDQQAAFLPCHAHPLPSMPRTPTNSEGRAGRRRPAAASWPRRQAVGPSGSTSSSTRHDLLWARAAPRASDTTADPARTVATPGSARGVTECRDRSTYRRRPSTPVPSRPGERLDSVGRAESEKWSEMAAPPEAPPGSTARAPGTAVATGERGRTLSCSQVSEGSKRCRCPRGRE
jgi:hypothetical protein